MLIIYHKIYRRKCRIFANFRFSCSNFDDYLRSKLQDTLFLLLAHRTESNIEIFRKCGPKRARHKEEMISCLDDLFVVVFLVEVRVVSLYQKKYNQTYLDCITSTIIIFPGYCFHRWLLFYLLRIIKKSFNSRYVYFEHVAFLLSKFTNYQ